jgi:ketosteroid isomerase-like protein
MRTPTRFWPSLLAIGLLIMAVGCASDPTATSEYGELEQELAQAKAQLAEVAANEAAIAAVEANETAYIDAFYAQDLDAFMDTFTDDAVFIDETFGDYFEGKAAIKSMYRNVITFADPEQSEVVDLFVAEDGTFAGQAAEWIGTNFYGNPFDLPTAVIHEYRDGKIVKETIYYASPDAYGQLMGSGS